MKLEHLYYLLEVAKQGSLNKAAKALFISQPNLSTAIKEAEEELNVQIFSRSNRGITVTDQGAEFLGVLTVIMDQLDFLLERYHLNHNKSERLFIVHNELFSLMEIFCQFKENRDLPDITCQMKSLTVVEMIDFIVSTSIPYLGIVALPRIDLQGYKQIFLSKKLMFEELFVTHGCLIVGHQHPYFQRETLTLEEAKQCEFAYYATSDFIQISKLLGFHVKERSFIVDSKENLLSLVAHSTICGVGNAYLELPFYRESSKLKYLPVLSDKTDIVFGTLMSQDFVLNDHYEEFLSYLKDDFLSIHTDTGV